jgi:hypothetical protein
VVLDAGVVEAADVVEALVEEELELPQPASTNRSAGTARRGVRRT